MWIIELLWVLYMVLLLGVAIYLRDLYKDIMKLRNHGKGVAFAHDDGTPYMPIPFFEEYGDTEEIKKLIKKRNRISILFCVMFALLFVITYFITMIQ